jgi:manganese oxidase
MNQMQVHDAIAYGNRVAETGRYEADTVNVGPGQRYDVVWTAREPGRWLLHCHIHGAGGLILIIEVT